MSLEQMDNIIPNSQGYIRDFSTTSEMEPGYHSYAVLVEWESFSVCCQKSEIFPAWILDKWICIIILCNLPIAATLGREKYWPIYGDDCYRQVTGHEFRYIVVLPF